MEDFKNLKRVAMNELRMLDEQYAGKEQFTDGDCKQYDLLVHALKCHLTIKAMLEAEEEEWEGSENGISGRRGRAANGRYVSRDGMPNRSYSQGFQDGVNSMQEPEASGHYPYPYYPRRW